MSDPLASISGDEFDPVQPPEIECLLLARAGDAGALLKVRLQTRACLEVRIRSICGWVFRHSCLAGILEFGVPTNADELASIMLDALDHAIGGWDEKKNWIGFSLRIAVTAGWEKVARFFNDSAVATVDEALKEIGFPPGIRNPLVDQVPAIAASICTKAPQKWLIESPALPTWHAFVLPHADEELRAALGKLAGEGERWPIDPVLDARILALAGSFAANRRGGGYAPLRDELANAAREWVALLVRACGSNQRPSDAFLFVAAKHEMKAMLSVTRSHNFSLIVWLIEDAKTALRLRLGEEPTSEDIARELDPDWAVGKLEKPRFSLSLIRNVNALFPVESDQKGGEMRAAKLAFALERLTGRAGLSKEQIIVLKSCATGMSHEAIGERLRITAAQSRKLHHRARLRIIVTAMKLSSLEWTVLNLKIAEGKSYLQIALKLGIPESDTKVLYHFAVEMIEMFPRLLTSLTQPERRVFQEGITGGNHADIAVRTGLSRDVVGGLLKSGIAKIPHLTNEK